MLAGQFRFWGLLEVREILMVIQNLIMCFSSFQNVVSTLLGL